MVYRKQMSSEILDFLREVGENWAVLLYYAECSGNSLPKVRDNLSVSSSRVKIEDHHTLRNSPEECSSEMPSVLVIWFRHFVVQTLIHRRYFFFSVKEIVFSVLWVKIVAEHLIIRCMWLNTILCLLTIWRKLSRVNYLLLQAGWAISTWRVNCLLLQACWAISTWRVTC
jgi:hypothetical protein